MKILSTDREQWLHQTSLVWNYYLAFYISIDVLFIMLNYNIIIAETQEPTLYFLRRETKPLIFHEPAYFDFKVYWVRDNAQSKNCIFWWLEVLFKSLQWIILLSQRYTDVSLFQREKMCLELFWCLIYKAVDRDKVKGYIDHYL